MRNPFNHLQGRIDMRRRGVWIVILALVIVVAGLTFRAIRHNNLQSWTDEHAVPTVSVVQPTSAGAERAVVLPGSIEAWAQAPVYARTNGYLKAWHADIGQDVKAGQVLAEIDTPDVAQQFAAAEGNLATSVAELRQAESTARRWQALLAQNAVSKQDAEDRQSALAVRRGMVKSAEAEMTRLKTLQEFRLIAAPFDGTVTSRATDIGSLVMSGTAAAQPLFTIADTSKMRIYVHVPQAYSSSVKQGMKASLTLPEYPGRKFEAELVSTSGAVNDMSGAMLVQLVADNSEKLLKPGAYAQVSFAIPADMKAVRIPSSALLFRPEGMTAALVGSNNRIVLKPIVITQDYGSEVEIAAGLSVSDRLVDSPPDALAEGDEVHVLQSQEKKPAS